MEMAGRQNEEGAYFVPIFAGGELPTTDSPAEGLGDFRRKSPRRPLTNSPTPVPASAPNGPKKTAATSTRVTLAPVGGGGPGATATGSAKGGIGSCCVTRLEFPTQVK